MILLINLPALHAQPTYDDIQFFIEPDKAQWNWKWLTSWYNRAFSRATLTATFAFVPAGWQLPVFHLTHTLLHFVNTLMVYGIAWILFDSVHAATAALIFAVSPLAVPAVSMISTRSVMLAAVFNLGAVWLALAGHPFLAMILVIPAVYAREDSVITILLIAALRPEQAVYILGIPFLIALGMMDKVIYVIRHKIANTGFRGMAAAGMDESLAQPDYTITSAVENVRRWLFWNVGLWQCHDPKITAVPRLAVFPATLILVALILAATLIPPAKVPILLILVSPWLASWFFPLPDTISESRAYPTIAGFALLVGQADLPWQILLLLIGILATTSTYKTYLHRHPIAYWTSAWKPKKPKLRVAINIGAAYQNIGDMNKAMGWHTQAMQIASTSGIVHANQGLWHEGMARMVRREVAQELINVGSIDSDKALACHKLSAEHLVRALELMSLGLYYCPEDPMVKEYHDKVVAHAIMAGIIQKPA